MSCETVLRWTRRGLLPAMRLPSGQIRYREADLEAWLAKRAAPERGVVEAPRWTPPSGKRSLDVVEAPLHEEDQP